MRYRFYFFVLLTVTSPCLAREIELADTTSSGHAKNFREEIKATLSGVDTTHWHLRKGRAEALVQVRDTTAATGWRPIADESFELVPVDETPAGRWSAIAGTSFLDDGEWPYIDREGNLWWARQREVFVLKGDRIFADDPRLSGAGDFARCGGCDVVFWTRPGFAHRIALRRRDMGDHQDEIEMGFDRASAWGRRWQRAILDARRTALSTPTMIRDTASLSMPRDAGFTTRPKPGLCTIGFTIWPSTAKAMSGAATLKSASQYRADQWHNYDRTDGLSDERVYRIAVGKNGDVWCTHGNRDDISVFDGGKWRVIDQRAGMPIGEVRAAVGARDGAFWFGTHHRDIADPDQSGLIRFDGQSWLVLTKSDGLPGNRVLRIAERPDKKLLLQIPDRALTVFEPDTTHWARISGHVENQRAISSIAVFATTPKGHVKASTATDASGYYEMRVLPGEYEVRVPDAWGGARDVIARPGEVVDGVNIRPMWFCRFGGAKIHFFSDRCLS